MSASLYDGYSRAPLRIGLAVITGVVLSTEALSVHMSIGSRFYVPTSAVLLRVIPQSPFILWAVVLAGLAGLVAFATDRRQVLSGTLALCSMAIIVKWAEEVNGSPPRNSFFPGGVLFGWVMGLVYARALAEKAGKGPASHAFQEEMAEAGAMAVFAALYVGSGFSKLEAEGLHWANSSGLRFLVLSQEGLGGFAWVEAYRNLLIEHPFLSQLTAIGTLVIETGGFFLLVSRSMRVVWGALIFLLHLNITILVTMPYLEPMAIALVFTVPWPAIVRRLSRRPPAPARDEEGPRLDGFWGRVPEKVLAAVAVVVILAWIVPFGWQNPRAGYVP